MQTIFHQQVLPVIEFLPPNNTPVFKNLHLLISHLGKVESLQFMHSQSCQFGECDSEASSLLIVSDFLTAAAQDTFSLLKPSTLKQLGRSVPPSAAKQVSACGQMWNSDSKGTNLWSGPLTVSTVCLCCSAGSARSSGSKAGRVFRV